MVPPSKHIGPRFVVRPVIFLMSLWALGCMYWMKWLYCPKMQGGSGAIDIKQVFNAQNVMWSCLVSAHYCSLKYWVADMYVLSIADMDFDDPPQNHLGVIDVRSVDPGAEGELDL